MKITLQELSGAFEALKTHLTELGQYEFDLADEHYWSICTQERYDRYEHPTDFSLGRLSEDLAHLKAIANGSEAPIAYGLVWLGVILRRIGESASET
jgi:hypothetical protein